MPSARRRTQLLLAALAAGVLSAGCSASGDAQDGAAPSASAADAQEVAYYRCLEKQGMALEVTDSGHLRVDKDKAAAAGAAKQQAAEDECRSKLPESTQGQASADALEAARKITACFRKNGVPEYPDPDPKTAEIKLSDELVAKVKRDFADVAAKCSPADGPGIVGG
ncbi:hypothetical protein [Streptomyces sp. TLI_185]|uniref:hypothetical protein n=1 Tax=Streptomyces sp. TLI_185 TaxID=2485151 RepID=UPI000F4FB29F|nr:hypothetical protein [Streptomyces sp. TLI_185]RPF34212.1 hypothetical protein EDD92_4157 [Streptomyces sp. TLI_185]